jgi:hypothetical protein
VCKAGIMLCNLLPHGWCNGLSISDSFYNVLDVVYPIMGGGRARLLLFQLLIVYGGLCRAITGSLNLICNEMLEQECLSNPTRGILLLPHPSFHFSKGPVEGAGGRPLVSLTLQFKSSCGNMAE